MMALTLSRLKTAIAPSPEAALEHQIGDLRGRASRLAMQLEHAEARRKEASEAQLRLLVEGEPDERSLAKADEALGAAERGKSSLEAAIRHVEEQAAAAEARLAKHKDDAERGAIAERLRGRAKALEAAGEKVVAAAATLRAALEQFAADVRKHGTPSGQFNEAIIQNVRAAASREGDGSEWVAPYFGAQPPATTSGLVSAAARALRDYADRVVSGEAPAIDPVAPEPVPPRPKVELTGVVLSEAISYQAESGVVQVPEGGVQIPSDVADECARLGIGFSPDSHDGQRILASLSVGEVPYARRPPGSPRRGPPYRHIAIQESARAARSPAD